MDLVQNGSVFAFQDLLFPRDRSGNLINVSKSAVFTCQTEAERKKPLSNRSFIFVFVFCFGRFCMFWTASYLKTVNLAKQIN